ncbi:Nitrate reductase [NADPH] [Verticillium dahliae VDG1]|nr:Nitrate reductase [NADPH] [Verticillium dahliae VDG1]
MANVLNSFFGGGKAADKAVPAADSDFADFAEAPNPVPTDTVFTRWYRVDQRHSLDEFRLEGIVISIGLVIFIVHLIGSRLNRSKSKAWARAHAPALKSEFASVGFSGRSTVESDPQAIEGVLKEKSLFEYAAYGTGRQNVAFVDVTLTLIKRFNPMISLGETLFNFFWDSVDAPRDIMDAVIYPFDGKETLTVPQVPGTHELRSKDSKSSYDGFVWAIVAKGRMKQLRDERYDLSITFTKDHSKLPNWATVMTESAEITEQLLTPEIIQAVELAGDAFDYLIVSDQPIDKPRTLEEATTARKRVFLRYTIPSNNDFSTVTPLFTQFLQLPDSLVAKAKFRPEILRKVNRVREEAVAQLKKEADAVVAEERNAERERVKKVKRDQELAGLDAKQQKRYLEKEREKETRKAAKKQTMRG